MELIKIWYHQKVEFLFSVAIKFIQKLNGLWMYFSLTIDLTNRVYSTANEEGVGLDDFRFRHHFTSDFKNSK